MIRNPAFTLKANTGVLRELITDAKVSLPKITSSTNPKLENTKALWDTGASGSAITESLAKVLGLKPIGKAQVNHANGISTRNVYMIDIHFNSVSCNGFRVTECHDCAKFGLIIGMDIISLGDFAITNFNGVSKFSFRIPSMADIDFVRDSNKKISPVIVENKPGRNDPCNCGSSKKYKHCCGKN